MVDRQAGLHDILSVAPVVPVLVIEAPRGRPCRWRAPCSRGRPAGARDHAPHAGRARGDPDASRGELEGAIVGAGRPRSTPTPIPGMPRRGRRLASWSAPAPRPPLLEAAAASPVPLLPGDRDRERGDGASLEHGCRYPQVLSLPSPRVASPISRRSPRPCPRRGSARPAGSTPGGPCSISSRSNVVCVGGSWVAPNDAVAAGDWPRIVELARAAAALKSSAT